MYQKILKVCVIAAIIFFSILSCIFFYAGVQLLIVDADLPGGAFIILSLAFIIVILNIVSSYLRIIEKIEQNKEAKL